ncbi:glycosyltransferase family 4 protein [Flavobacterium gawalongense]|uniref:Glycosyltransferase family 4 protein n=1 Tax=Flavobacterium gawalongense TaxID=2594432 RepID=A0A553BQV9_9FLAO|nr:glycosyltransferase family 4 protein [Flavobacterium gawalongense]TRX00956.1 glycosyltransferase family 4 protein [Flavobacterium gawalongense]TRX05505.1 glycosyltransferase family 4 protein [Flavobacterium gawalongense]TRX10631.1 glycosyltransferase family 4 protein [Flavobacterium gawalongense]TRX11780.1 glycosyltransferase family 4 protein [Flavobacterium gawalongense]TRX29572.1 glycosyltransferase family 4 protein [Flavobacterium gawalongense]
MKLLYIVPNINNEGGVARVLSIKANYLVEKLGYEVHILTQNEGFSPLFYSFNSNIIFHDMILKGNVFQFFNSFAKALKSKIKTIQPDVIIVCDNGLKAYSIPFILKNKTPLILEIHSSKFIEERESKKNILTKVASNCIHLFKRIGIKKYDRFVVETSGSISEWNINNTIVIPNPLWFASEKSSDLESKKVIAVGRHTYEKGFDRMLQIWKKVVAKHPDWILEIYGKSNENIDLRLLAENLNVSNNVVFHEPIQNIDEKYLEASFYLMTSRFEGFGMVLIEAMASGLPCVAYDCPCGPRGVLSQNEDSFLIENRNETEYIKAVETLIENATLRKEMGKKAKLSSEKYNIDEIMQTWNQLFIGIKKS